MSKLSFATGKGSHLGSIRHFRSDTYGLMLLPCISKVVKRILIDAVSKPGDILIDYAVGKGGDFPKWIHSKLSFVFGLDIAKDKPFLPNLTMVNFSGCVAWATGIIDRPVANNNFECSSPIDPGAPR